MDNEPENKNRPQMAVIRQLQLVIYIWLFGFGFFFMLDTFSFSGDESTCSWHYVVYENVSEQ